MWEWIKAYFRTDLKAVCRLSEGRGLYDDFHDYKDTADKQPWHMEELECERCGKKFCI